jgi:dihydrofolate synthase / folylpolyglutamate synthase
VNYQEALGWLYSLQRFGIKLGLDNIRRLIAEYVAAGSGRWDTGWKPGLRVIHVAGTNGKGSVCAMIDSICRAAGLTSGVFTSPHLVSFRERIRVNGDMISEAAVAAGLTNIRNLVFPWDSHPTFFEVTTALALKYFSHCTIGICILETGLGGRLDATNAVPSDVAVITPIDFDHEKWLGDSLEKIAAEKAGIIKSRMPVISAPQPAEAEKIIRARAAECEAPLHFVNELYDKSAIALRGTHQKLNAAIAIAALKLNGLTLSSFAGAKAPSNSATALPVAGIAIDDAVIARGLASVEWPARFQQWDERLVIDGAHNPAAARVLAQTWRDTFGQQRATLILAILDDKGLRGICEALAPIADFVLLPKIRSARGAEPATLAKILTTILGFCRASATPAGNRSGCPTIALTRSVAEALKVALARPNPILLTGSLHFAGEALAYLRGEPAAFEECLQ